LENARDAAVIEGSSIGFEQRRLDGLKINAAGFTNFTRDHLDYHGSMEEYYRCKTLLFSRIMRNGVAVLNSDIPEYDNLRQICKREGHDIISFGKTGDLKLLDMKPTHDGQQVKISVMGEKSEHRIPLVGSFQTYNILCALGLVIGCGMAKKVATSFIDKLVSIPGRMEHATEGVYVDYAHTPDALENALKSLRPHTKGKLFVVFGCGGDRDKGKRPQMGKIASDLADIAIVTDDNPRTEEPAQIRKEILAASPKAIEIGDRTEAIKHAMAEMKQGDILLIAGKGHEKYQIYGTEKTHYDDVEVVRNI
jgi:UDP-N-acetylmuramoyl-L-alanyl-D-glutamate--2,6-diaminopimelate ligase